jgi:predicted nucleotidyltransferase
LLLEELFGCPVDLITHKSIRPEIRPQIERDSIAVA